MNFYQSVFLEKNFLRNIHKKVGFGGNYPLIFTLSGQSYDSKNYLQKLRLYMLRIFGVAKKSETFKILVIFLLETCKSNSNSAQTV